MMDYSILKEVYSLSDIDLDILLVNLSDAFAFNEYLFNEQYRDDFSYDINSLNKLFLLKKFFMENGISFEMASRIVISVPMVLLYSPGRIELIKNDDFIEGIIIIDNNGNRHFYKFNYNYNRSIVESKNDEKRRILVKNNEQF